MSLHIEAKPGEIAPTVLLPGDPLRAEFIAEKYFENPVRHNRRRAAFGFTGTYQGLPVSVQATGMGVPSISIYVHELIAEYGVKNLIRVGTCGAIQENLELNDIIIAMSACTDSDMNRRPFDGRDFAPTANFDLLKATHDRAIARGLPVRVGSVLTSDLFYDTSDFWKPFADHGVLAVEMETAALYTHAARHRVRALSIVTVSDVIPKGTHMDPDDRERALDRMVTLALEAVAHLPESV